MDQKELGGTRLRAGDMIFFSTADGKAHKGEVEYAIVREVAIKLRGSRGKKFTFGWSDNVFLLKDRYSELIHRLRVVAEAFDDKSLRELLLDAARVIETRR